MITRNGYIADNLERLSIGDIEATIIDLSRDNYINEWNRRELLGDYMRERWYKLQKAFEYTEENIWRLNEANELLKASAERVARKAWRLYHTEKEHFARHPHETFNNVSVDTHLYVPCCYETDKKRNPLIVGDVEETLWDALAAYYKIERSGGIMMSCHLYSIDDDYKSEDDFVSNVLWGSSYEEDPKLRSWGHDCLMDMEAVKDICFVWPFHSLVSHEYMALSDLIKIRGYKESITVEYGRTDNEDD